MATRRTPDPTRSPKSAAAPKSTAAPKSAKSPAEPKATTPKPSEVAAGAASSTAPAQRVAKPKAPKAATAAARTQISEDTRRAMIAESAYLRAERRGFAPGHEHADWCAAEKEVDALLNASTGAGRQ